MSEKYKFHQLLCLSLEPSSGLGHRFSYITVVHVEESQEWLGCQNHFAREIFIQLISLISHSSLQHSEGHSSRAGSPARPPTSIDTEDNILCQLHAFKFNLTHTAFSIMI